MCNNFPNIKVVEGNAFSVVVPLKVRTFESCRPIDEDIDPTQLTNVVFKFGGVQYTPVIDERGVSAALPATLARGTYDIVVTGDYGENPIRAAYEGAVTIVPWNSQSDAQQYLPGSPIVLRAAYVLGAPLTDAELEALKEEYREKNAQLQQAIADAEEAKREWEQKAADLDGVAQEATLQGVGADAAAAKTAAQNAETKAQEARDAALALAPVAQAAEAYNTGKVELAEAITEQGVPTLPSVSLLQMAENVSAIVTDHISTEGTEWAGDAPLSLTEALLKTCGFLEEITDNREIVNVWDYGAFGNLKRIRFSNTTDLSNVTFYSGPGVSSYGGASTHKISSIIEEIYAPKAERIHNRFVYDAQTLRVLYLPHANVAAYGQFTIWEGINHCTSLIDLTTGEYFTVSTNTLLIWNPTNALLSNSQSLLTLEDIAAGFTSNLEKLLYNIREHIAANLPDRTGQSALTLTMSANIKAAIQADTATANAFANKNWIIA